MSCPLISSLFSLVAQTLNRLPVGLIQFLFTTINRSASQSSSDQQGKEKTHQPPR